MRYFLALAEELNFTRAAARCHISQPPFSRAISQLEHEIGARLFERDKHKVTVTLAGQTLIEDATQALAVIDRGIERARQVATGLQGSLRMGFGGSTVYSLLPQLIRRFRSVVSDVEIEFCPMPVLSQIEALRNGEIDLGLLRLPIFDESLETQHVYGEPLVAALPSGHPLLARSGAVSIAELRHDRFVAYEPTRGFNFHSDLVALCRFDGYDPQIAHRALTTEAVIGIVACGEGVAIVPASAERLRMRGVSFRPLDAHGAPQHLLNVEFALAWRREGTPATAFRFAELVTQDL
jgi:LysR family transcriptional regulator, benzoate and cis,cis-muconate-responsive activator of ben and cat genes